MEGSSVNINNNVNTISTVKTVKTTDGNTTTYINNENIQKINNNPPSNMKNPPLNVGVIIPPDAHYKPILYSDHKATADFVQLNRDIYQSAKKSKNINKKKTPLSVKILAGLAVIGGSILFFIKR